MNTEELALICTLPPMPCRETEEELEQVVLTRRIDWERADAVNKAFLALVNWHYWKYLETRDLRPGSKEAEVLLTSVAYARSHFNGTLIDFDYVFPFVNQCGKFGEIGYGIDAVVPAENG